MDKRAKEAVEGTKSILKQEPPDGEWPEVSVTVSDTLVVVVKRELDSDTESSPSDLRGDPWNNNADDASTESNCNITLVKEPLDAAGDTCANVYDALLDVVKHEVGDGCGAAASDSSAARGKRGPAQAEVKMLTDTWNTASGRAVCSDDRASIRPCVVVLNDVLKAPSEAAPTRDGSRRAQRRAPTAREPAACDVYGRRSQYQSDLVKHIRTHTGEKPYVCSLCSYKSALKAALVNHIRTHTGEKPYACSMCSYKSGVKGALVRHIRTHTGEKPYACSMCSYKSGRKENLVSHMRSHTGEKPYACSMCSFKSTRKEHLVIHMRSHTGEKPYACSMCSYKSGRKGNLVIHMRSHTGEKPYACSMCSYKSGHKSLLVKHMRTHINVI